MVERTVENKMLNFLNIFWKTFTLFGKWK